MFTRRPSFISGFRCRNGCIVCHYRSKRPACRKYRAVPSLIVEAGDITKRPRECLRIGFTEPFHWLIDLIFYHASGIAYQTRRIYRKRATFLSKELTDFIHRIFVGGRRIGMESHTDISHMDLRTHAPSDAMRKCPMGWKDGSGRWNGCGHGTNGRRIGRKRCDGTGSGHIPDCPIIYVMSEKQSGGLSHRPTHHRSSISVGNFLTDGAKRKLQTASTYVSGHSHHAERDET